MATNQEQDNKAKRVSFSKPKTPAAGVGHADQDMELIQAGCKLFKVRGRKKYLRVFTYDRDLSCISWESSHKRSTKSRIYLSNIHEIRTGKSTESYRNSKAGVEFSDAQCFSIIYGPNYEILDLASKEMRIINAWTTLLQSLIGGRSVEYQPIRDRWLKEQFELADKDVSGTLEEKECSELLHALNLNISKKQIGIQFKQYDANGNGKLDFDEFKEFFESLSTRDEIVKIFNDYAHPANVWENTDFLIFLKSSQKWADIDEAMVNELIEKYEPTDVKAQKRLSLDGFTNFLLDPKHFVYDHHHREVHQDMSQPLSHYFIASSHNTYLLEDQFRGPSSVEGYIRSLRSGCRCVEMDVWNGPQGNPIIYHGHTLTSKIQLDDVLKAVNEHAFVCTPFPVIISIENHCSIDQQSRMAQMFQSIFGDKLYLGATDDSKDDLPSPDSFLNKILIKGKKLRDETDIGDVSDEDEASEMDTPEDMKAQVLKQEQGQDSKDSPSAPEDSSVSEEAAKPNPVTVAKKTESSSHNKIKLSIQLSKVVNYIQASPFKGLDKALNLETMYYAMSSFSEPKTESIMSKEGWKFVEYNKRQLSRIYPKGARIDSSNYNPVPMWYHGCQIVALNYQTNGEMMDINNGFFSQNGRSGYILKPACLRERFLAFDPSSTSLRGAPGSVPRKYTIVAISGQQLPKPSGSTRRGEVIDPYVLFTVYGPGMNNHVFKTKMIDDNGFNPNWNETFHFEAKFPELTTVRIVVFDYDRLSEDDFIGQFTVPLNCLMPGYRHVPLLTKEGNIIEFASIFLHITIEDERIHSNRKPEDFSSQCKKISRNLTRDVSTLVADIEGLVVDSCALFDNFYHSFTELRKFLGLNQEATIIQCLKSIYSRDTNLKIRITKTEKEYQLDTEIGDKVVSNRAINLLRDLVNQCSRVVFISPSILTVLGEATSNCKKVLKSNSKILNQSLGNSYKLFDMAIVVGQVWTQQERLKEASTDAQITLELIGLWITKHNLGTVSRSPSALDDSVTQSPKPQEVIDDTNFELQKGQTDDSAGQEPGVTPIIQVNSNSNNNNSNIINMTI